MLDRQRFRRRHEPLQRLRPRFAASFPTMLKPLLSLFLASSLCGFLIPAHAAPLRKNAKPRRAPVAAVRWQPTYAKALALSKRTGRPLFVDFYTTWCSPCQYMDKVAFRSPQFAAAARGWVLVKVDAERELALAQKLGVSLYPTFVMLDKRARPIGRITGARRAPEMAAALRHAARSARV